jgi:hypothetical protein
MSFIKQLLFSGFLLSFLSVTAQNSENLIPKDAVTVFSINNINLFQKISLDELISYDFMYEVHQELFDGSTSGSTLKDSGLDFNQKLNVFYGKAQKSEISGFSFGVKDQQKLFTVFDDFDLIDKMSTEKTKVYGSFFNNLIIRENSALLIRVEPTMDYISEMTDSIWYARGNESPFDYFGYDEEEPSILDEKVFGEEEEIIEEEAELFPDASEDPNVKNYYELRDSVQLVLQQAQLEMILNELLVQNINLPSFDNRFANQLTHNSEGVFYMDNARNIDKASGLWYFQTVLPSLYKDIQELYAGNVILGDIFLKDHAVQFDITAEYGVGLGAIYKEMNDSKFDKNILKYIPNNSSGYFSYNVNMRQAYEKAYEIIMPILSEEKNAQIAMNVLTIELLNEFINKDALFGTYKGSMFGSFNGFKKIKTKKIEFFYDEETFEYGERVAEAEEDMPIFTYGITIDRADIPEKVLKHFGRLTSKIQNKGNYWVFENAIFDAAPLYMINKNGLFILTNDEDLAVNHTDGYGKEKINRKAGKKAKKSGFMYANINVAETINRFPMDVLNDRQNEIIQTLKGKSGSIELISSKTSLKKTDFKIEYTFQGEDTSGKHLLDLINSIYIVTK